MTWSQIRWTETYIYYLNLTFYFITKLNVEKKNSKTVQKKKVILTGSSRLANRLKYRLRNELAEY